MTHDNLIEKIAQLRIDLYDANRDVDKLMITNMLLSQEVERLKAALDKYSDRENWSEDRSDVWIMTPNGYDIARSAKSGDA